MEAKRKLAKEAKVGLAYLLSAFIATSSGAVLTTKAKKLELSSYVPDRYYELRKQKSSMDFE